MTAVIVNIEEQRIVQALRDAAKKLNSAEPETVLDFSSVRRVDASAVRALQDLAAISQEKSVKVALRGVNVDVYKVFKLVKLTARFSFVN